MEKIRTDIEKNRDLRKITLDLYMRNLRLLNGNKTFDNLDFLLKRSDIEKKLDELANTTKRSYIATIIVALKTDSKKYKKEIDHYSERLSILNNEINEFLKKNIKTPTQEKNMVSLRLLLKKQREYKKRVEDKGLFLKDNYNPSEKKLIKYYLIASLYTLQPPIRLDYSPMKIIRNIKDDDGKQNYLYIRSNLKKQFIFNNFKTSKSLGKQIVKIEPALNKVINIWLRVNTTDNFLTNKTGAELSSNSLGKMISKVFDIKDKHITLNTIRHIYISDKIDIDRIKRENEEKEKLANSMLHSAGMQKHYAKHD